MIVAFSHSSQTKEIILLFFLFFKHHFHFLQRNSPKACIIIIHSIGCKNYCFTARPKLRKLNQNKEINTRVMNERNSQRRWLHRDNGAEPREKGSFIVIVWCFMHCTGASGHCVPLPVLCTDSIAQVNKCTVVECCTSFYIKFIASQFRSYFSLYLLFECLAKGLMCIPLLPGYHFSTKLIYELRSSVRFRFPNTYFVQ